MPNSDIAAVAELAAHSHSVITRSQAAVHLSDKRIATAIRQGWLGEPYPGVLVFSGAPATYRQRVRAAVLAAGGHGVASHRSAARLHHLDGLTTTTIVELSIARSHRWQAGRTVVTHHVSPLDERDIVLVDGIRTTSLPRTLADLGSVVRPADRVAQALTDARRRGYAIGSIRATAERLHRPGQAGTGVLMRLLDAIPFEARVPESWFEELLARCLAHPSIPSLVPQYEVFDSARQLVGRVDLAIPELKLAIEAHSRRHHFGPQAEAADAHRDLRLASLGWEVLYVGWHAVKQPAVVGRIVADVVAARRADLRNVASESGVGRSEFGWVG